MGYLKAPCKCKFKEVGNWIELTSGKKVLRYPRPENIVTLNKDEFEEGESICVAYNTSSPIFKLNSLIKLMVASGSHGQRYYEKDSIILSDCYAYEDGEIQYVEDRSGEIIDVRINGRSYQYNPKCMYYFPNGSKVKKFDRICSGVVNMDHVTSELKDKINDIYLIFRKQFYTLSSGDFQKTGISALSDPQEELVELLFSGLLNITYDPDTLKIDEVTYAGVGTGNKSKKSFYTVLSYGYSSQVVEKALRGEVNLSGDVIILKLSKNLKLNF